MKDLSDDKSRTESASAAPKSSPQLEQEMGQEVSSVEAEHVPTAIAVDNDHTLDDAQTHTQLSRTSAALEKEKTKRRSKPLLVFLLALLMALLGAVAGVSVYKAYFEKQLVASTTPAPQPSVAKLTAKGVISSITDAYLGTSADQASAQPIKVAGANYFTNLSATHYVAIKKSVGATQAPIDTAVVTKVLLDKGFTQKSVQPGDESAAKIIDFSEADVVCRFMSTPAVNNTAGDTLIEIACANMSDYTTVSTAAKPFYAPLPSELKTSTLLLTEPRITASKTSGYQLATVGIGTVTDSGDYGVGGAAGLFYQTPDGTWHFFKGTQSVSSCSEYATPDLKKAYLGETCYLDNKQLTVTL